MAHKTRTSDTELMPNGRLLLTLPELAAHLRIDRATVYRLLQRRELPIPILRLGRSPRVRSTDVERCLADLAGEEQTNKGWSRLRADRALVSRGDVNSLQAQPSHVRSRPMGDRVGDFLRDCVRRGAGRGEGNIIQRPDGRWVARVSLSDGTRKAFYGRTRQDVADKLTDALAARRKGMLVTSGRRPLAD